MIPTNLPQQKQQEFVFYRDASPILITPSRAVLLDKTFAIRNIASVSMEKSGSTAYLEYALVAVGLVLLWFGATTDLSQLLKVGAFVGAGLVALIAACVLIVLKRPGYYLVLGIGSGQVKAIFSKDPNYITNLVNMLNWALACNRASPN